LIQQHTPGHDTQSSFFGSGLVADVGLASGLVAGVGLASGLQI
jgi:hypothetical protein